MNNEKMGQFISELRKSHQMTQKELAIKLNVSDKAVSKWERGLSCPDISLLSPLSEIFGITATELLNGQRTGSENVNVEAVVVTALEYGKESAKHRLKLNRNIIASAYSTLLLIGIFVVLVVDLAISRTFTWSPIPVISCIFAWLVFFPAIKFVKKGIVSSLIAFSVFTVPFLYVLDYVVDRLIKSNIMLFDMGVRIAPFAIAYIWITYLLSTRLRTRVLLVISILVLLTSPVSYFTNSIIANMLHESYDVFDVVLNTFPPVIVASILFVIDSIMRNRKHHES